MSTEFPPITIPYTEVRSLFSTIVDHVCHSRKELYVIYERPGVEPSVRGTPVLEPNLNLLTTKACEINFCQSPAQVSHNQRTAPIRACCLRITKDQYIVDRDVKAVEFIAEVRVLVFCEYVVPEVQSGIAGVWYE